ncbi:MAG: outer membrane beta-barrel protein [Xanthobacteraceae bacterium]
MRKLFLAVLFAACGAGVAVAADMPVKAVYGAPPVPNWSGPYVGAHLGGAWGYFRPQGILPGPSDVGGNVTFGGHAGYNWQSGRTVFGAEADLSWIDIAATSPGASFEEDWMGTLRLRLGYLIEPYLLYVTGGVGFTRVETAVVGSGADAATRAGLTAGVGIESKFSPNWSGRLEALFVDVPRRAYNNGGFVTGGGSHNYVIRAGISYHAQP